jgi:hypothetical protein
LQTGLVTERPRVREIDDDEGWQLVRIITGFLITAVEEARSRLRDWDGGANHPGLLIQPGRSPWRGAAAPEG